MLTKFLWLGKTVNLTGDNINISSTNFKVDKNGNMTCNNASMNNANITGGQIKLKDTSSTGSRKILIENESNSNIKTTIGTSGFNFSGERYNCYFLPGATSNLNQFIMASGDEQPKWKSIIAMEVYDNNAKDSQIYLMDFVDDTTSKTTTIKSSGISTPKIELSGVEVLSYENKSNHIGTSSEYSGYTTKLRGNIVRIYSHSSGAVYLGSSGSTAVTSDEKLKDIYEIDAKYIDFFKNLKPITYIYKDKGHRNHIGFGARQVEESLTKAGLTTEQFAGVLKDTDVTISADEAGAEEDIHYDELYSLRYEEFIALNTMMIQKQTKLIEQLQNEIKKLKEEK